MTWKWENLYPASPIYYGPPAEHDFKIMKLLNERLAEADKIMEAHMRLLHKEWYGWED